MSAAPPRKTSRPKRGTRRDQVLAVAERVGQFSRRDIDGAGWDPALVEDYLQSMMRRGILVRVSRATRGRYANPNVYALRRPAPEMAGGAEGGAS